MTIEQILDYVMYSPENTNRAVLGSMLDQVDITNKDIVLEYCMSNLGNVNFQVLSSVLYSGVSAGPNYLTFTAEEANAPLEMAAMPGAPEMDLWYSFDKKNWEEFEIGVLDSNTFEVATHGTVITLENIGDKVYFKGNNDHGFCVYDEEKSHSYPNEFIIREKKISVSGNIMTIMNETGVNNTLYENNFDKLFVDCYMLTDASELELPSMTLAPYCYSYMFANQSGFDSQLVSAPELPATTLAECCYSLMFSGCTSLVNAPELPATTLAGWCYNSMFRGCTSLVNAPELPATTLVTRCYSMMFNNCTSLINAPELPATTLAESCYERMFMNCHSLNNVSVRFTSFITNGTTQWLSFVSSTGTFTCPADLEISTRGTTTVPEGWTIVRR